MKKIILYKVVVMGACCHGNFDHDPFEGKNKKPPFIAWILLAIALAVIIWAMTAE